MEVPDYQNDAVGAEIGIGIGIGLPTPPLEDNGTFPPFSNPDIDFDFDFDFDFDLPSELSPISSFLVLELPNPDFNSDCFGSAVSQNGGNPNSRDFGDDRVSGDVVRVSDAPISSQESGFQGRKNYSPEFDSSKTNSGVYQDSSREMIKDEHAKPSSEDGRNDSSGSASNCVKKSKRKKGHEQDRTAETRKNKLRRSNAKVNVISSDKSVEGEEGGDEDEKKMARLIRNRESAHLSRQRKKQYVEELEDKVKSMMSTVTDLNGRISYFMAENATLRQQLSGVMPPPGVPGAGMYPAPPMAGMPYPWVPYPPYMVNPHGSHVPLVPIPRLKPQQPTSAPKVKRSSEGKTKTKKVASVSLLGLLFFMLLFGGLVPMVDVRYRTVENGIVQKGSVFKVDKNMEKLGHGGVIQQSNSPIGGNINGSLVASLYVPRNDKLVKIDGNLIIHSVIASEKAMASQLAERQKTSEETGLAIHGSFPPYPTPEPGSNDWRHPYLERNQNGRQKALGSGSTGFTPIGSDGKLQQWFREGLAGPMLSSGMCTEVFQFDVSPTPRSIVPATSIANITSGDRLNSTRPNKTKNRRILHPLPLYDHSLNTSNEHVHQHEQSDGLQSNKSRSSVVVSVLVDPREVGDGDGEGLLGPKTLSRIFVVVLIDSVKYVTYSCMLPFMGSNSQLIST